MTEEKVIDLSKLLEHYEGKWVAISADKSRVLFAADTLEGVIKESENCQGDKPTVLRVPDQHTPQLP